MANPNALAPKILRYHSDLTQHLEWFPQAKEKVPPPYTGYWVVKYKGKHVADLFKGKSYWFVIVFNRFTFRGANIRDLCLHLVGVHIHRNN